MDELNRLYEGLRGELDMAYEAPKWDCERINRIALELARVEQALARQLPPRPAQLDRSPR